HQLGTRLFDETFEIFIKLALLRVFALRIEVNYQDTPCEILGNLHSVARDNDENIRGQWSHFARAQCPGINLALRQSLREHIRSHSFSITIIQPDHPVGVQQRAFDSFIELPTISLTRERRRPSCHSDLPKRMSEQTLARAGSR